MMAATTEVQTFKGAMRIQTQNFNIYKSNQVIQETHKCVFLP